MKNVRLVAVACAVFVVSLSPVARADKTPDLGKTKFKDLVKYLDLTSEQQVKIKPDVDRIQEIVKDASRQTGASGGKRVPVGGSGPFGRPGGAGGVQTGGGAGNPTEVRAQRQEWQREISNRVEEIKSFLTPAQLEKFKSVQVPDLLAKK